jgi:hypothetical protein
MFIHQARISGFSGQNLGVVAIDPSLSVGWKALTAWTKIESSAPAGAAYT